MFDLDLLQVNVICFKNRFLALALVGQQFCMFLPITYTVL